jgi:hypothetical protein
MCATAAVGSDGAYVETCSWQFWALPGISAHYVLYISLDVTYACVLTCYFNLLPDVVIAIATTQKKVPGQPGNILPLSASRQSRPYRLPTMR